MAKPWSYARFRKIDRDSVNSVVLSVVGPRWCWLHLLGRAACCRLPAKGSMVTLNARPGSAAKTLGKRLRSLPPLLPFLLYRARFLNTVAALGARNRRRGQGTLVGIAVRSVERVRGR